MLMNARDVEQSDSVRNSVPYLADLLQGVGVV